MVTGEHATRTNHRSRRARPGRRRVRDAIVLLALAAAIVALVGDLLGGAGGAGGTTTGGARVLRGTGGADATLGRWPSQGQAAIVVGGGEVKASPGQEPAPIASLAKVMTAYLTLQRFPLGAGGEGFTMTVSAAQAEDVADEADQGQSVVAVAPGERLTERQLLEALLIPSGNNIARMLAARVAGSEADFVDAMNEAAAALGMDDTTYTDPSGFDPGTVSTAADQLRVFRAAMRSPAFRQIVATPSVTLPVAGTLTNFNPLLGAGFAGKTGSDSAAGGCLAFFTRVGAGGHRATAVGVVMGQGEGGDTGELLGAAGQAAIRLVGARAGTRTGTGLAPAPGAIPSGHALPLDGRLG
jgi:serine-type D-Ala-D-Ala carboxypeptidase (penicillin-binding protein 5/6)